MEMDMQIVSAQTITKTRKSFTNLLLNLLHTSDHEQIQTKNRRNLLHNVYAITHWHVVVSRTEMCGYSTLFFNKNFF